MTEQILAEFVGYVILAVALFRIVFVVIKDIWKDL